MADQGVNQFGGWYQPYQISNYSNYAFSYSLRSEAGSYAIGGRSPPVSLASIDGTKPLSSALKYVVGALFLFALLATPPLIVMLADNAQLQRVANVFYSSNSLVVQHDVEVADPSFDTLSTVLEKYGLHFHEEVPESPVVEALRRDGHVKTVERFESLWDYFAFYDAIDIAAANRVFVQWLGMANPHLHNDTDYRYIRDALTASSKINLHELPFEDHRLDDLEYTDGFEYNEAVNHFRFFQHIEKRFLLPADIYVNNGRVLDAQRLIRVAADRVRLLDIDSSTAYKYPANQVFVLEMLFADTDAIIKGQTELREIYRAIRELDWSGYGRGPWWDLDGLVVVSSPLFDIKPVHFPCQVYYLRNVRNSRVADASSYDAILQNVRDWRRHSDCSRIQLVKEWFSFLELRILASRVFSVSCVRPRPLRTVNFECGEGPRNRKLWTQRKTAFQTSADTMQFSINKNLIDDVRQLESLVENSVILLAVEQPQLPPDQ